MALTVAAVKGKLRIPAADTSKDADIGRSLAAARRRFQDRTRYDLEAQTNLVDTFQRVQVGTIIRLTHRPVASVSQVQARTLGQSPSWETVGYDVVDGSRGQIVLLGGSTQAGWPPREPGALWDAWMDPYWPLVKVTYSTSAFPLPEDLEDAVHSLASYWYELHLTGAKSSSALSGVGQEAYRSWASPPWFEAAIARHSEEAILS